MASKSLKNVHKGKFRSENDIHFPAVYGVLTMLSVSYTVQLRMVGLLRSIRKNIEENYPGLIGFTILKFAGGRAEVKGRKT